MAKARVKLEEITALKAKGLSNKDIAKVVNCTPATVWSNLKLAVADNKNIEQFNQDLPKHLSRLIARLVAQLANVELDKCSPYQLAGMLSLLIDKHRLITGQSTSNQALLFHMVEQACKPVTPDKVSE